MPRRASPGSLPSGRRRVVIEGVSPQVDGGRFPVKRTIGDEVVVEADAFTDGQDAISCVLRWRRAGAQTWHEVPMRELVNDRWRGSFRVDALGRYQYAVVGWVDAFKTWRRDMFKRVEAAQDVTVDLLIGARLVQAAAQRASGADAARLGDLATRLEAANDLAAEVALADELDLLMRAYPDRMRATEHDPGFTVWVDPVLARFSAWYELFPRSVSARRGTHGTFSDVERLLPEIAALGFDVLYLPPIHPIGRSKRKGRNNAITAGPDDVGSPWAIGAEEGGHKAVHPELGTAKDFRRLVRAAREEYGIEVALDIAFQAAPDHPYVREHPEWFRARPDGTIQFAENPPKKYQDIYPFDFDSDAWHELWLEMKSVFDYWIEQGVHVFRVDNPHTKPFPFWEWCIDALKADHPEVILLSEAFTRPKVMYRLAKVGFTQSYTYFAWRNAKWELEQYLTELTTSNVREYFRPNFWPNTPDILTEYLQTGGRPAFMIRLVLAATLSSNYGIYGPAYELLEHLPREAGSEEYLNSEKYEIRNWDCERPDNLRDFITRVNRIRRDNPALQRNGSLRFHTTDNDALIAYSKLDAVTGNLVLSVVNVDPYHVHSGFLELPLADLGLGTDQPFQVHDLLGDGRYQWHGPRNYVELNPHVLPAHIFRVRRRMRSERDFEYFL
ncbi:MAG: alpha-1,4-glucan--maltose-1-phosphate maltosyltransferase [Longimicrobiales bacterium]